MAKLLSKSVKKTFSVAALTVLIGIALSGCSGSAAQAPTSTPETAITSTQQAVRIQKIDAKQQASLLEEFKKIDPSLDNRRSVEKARQQCRMILENNPEAEQIALAKESFGKRITKPAESPDETAKKIITIIKNNGFCKAAE